MPANNPARATFLGPLRLPAVLFLGILAAVPFHAGAIQRWERYYSWDYNEEGRMIIQTPDSGYVVTGATTSFGPGAPDFPNPFLIKLDPSGEIVWKHVYGTVAPEYAMAVDRSADGGYIIAGSKALSDTDDDFLAIRTDSTGNAIWTRKYGRPGWRDDCMAAQACRSGGYVFAGVTTRYGIPGDVYVVRTNPRGVVVWSGIYGAGFADEKVYSIQETTDGGFILGITRILAGSAIRNIVLLKLNAFGQTDWIQTYPGSSWCQSVRQTADGGYILAGGVLPDGSTFGDVFLLKVDAAGGTQWKLQLGAEEGSDGAWAVDQMVDGSYVACGTTQADVLSHWDLLALRVDHKGNLLWKKTFGSQSFDEAGWSDCATTDGGAVLCGYETGQGPGQGIYVIKIDEDGNASPPRREPLRPVRIVEGSWAFANPFSSFASIAGREGERFVIYDVLGRKAGEYGGSRIANDLPPGVYTMRMAGSRGPAVRIVKIR